MRIVPQQRKSMWVMDMFLLIQFLIHVHHQLIARIVLGKMRFSKVWYVGYVYGNRLQYGKIVNCLITICSSRKTGQIIGNFLGKRMSRPSRLVLLKKSSFSLMLMLWLRRLVEGIQSLTTMVVTI